MTENAFISVVIPTYNNADFVNRAIKSLFDQTYPKNKYEIIIVDDGSTDNTRQCIELLQRQSPCNLRYLFQENKGPSAARNLGIRNASGDIIAFSDADCLPSKVWLEAIVKGYEDKDDSIAGIGGTIKAVPTVSKVSQYCAYAKMNERPKIDKTGIVYLITGNASFRKECLQLVGGFDERYNFPGGEDPDLCYRLKKLGYFFRYASNAVVYNSHKESEREILKTYFNYGKGDAFLALRIMSSWDLISVSGIKWLLYFLKAAMKATFLFMINLKLIIRFFKIPFKALLYYAEGLNMKDSLTYSFLDYLKQFAFIQGAFIGYIIGKFKGFKRTYNDINFL